jgi:hypothetical protein
MQRLRNFLFFGLLLLAVEASPLHAQITVHTTFASWLAAVSGDGLDTFDDLDPTDGFTDSPAARTAGAFSYTASSPSGLFPSGTAPDAWLSNFFVEDAITFDEFSPNAFGVAGQFFLTGEDGQLGVQGDLTLTVTSGAFSTTETIVNAFGPLFLGFTSVDAITSLEVQAVGASPQNGIFATVNNFRVGAAPISTTVPEPASMALLVAGVGGLVGVARRRGAQRA